ncbi:MAG: MATE family efflux transporter [Paeniclostridium sordellii]|uniref:Probable multidrug resistance protein NorM n=1 Tax=Paeniclostridium hominis TaxID=2764329 RepID=A0ABR7K7U9_9FIRM|nr:MULTISPECIES: MATE family efflux transporter [Paeniclostridium]MBC6004939.1 MATE family efflux transporter [Paeniclostridium hominis]MDU2591853.1 MATE family efflux transporter [Paeniclostridium sordellii]
MQGRIDLTEGKIIDKLIKLALPIMGTSFIQMAYNMVDMVWVGKAGSSAVAAVGTAGFFPWLAMAFVAISRVGGEVQVAQSMGKNDAEETKSYIKAAIEVNIILSLIYTLVLLIFKDSLIGFFNLGDANVISMSKKYLVIVALGMIFYFINPIFTAIFNGMGNSKDPFRINTVGLITNIILDPLLILGIGPFPKLGVEGAAIATVFSQFIVTMCFIVMIMKRNNEYFKVKLFRKISLEYYKSLCKLGMPVAIQSGMFTIFSMLLGVIVASWGPVAIAAQKVGSQIEAISWMTADGIAVALSSFVGQNYGATKYDRINKGFKITLGIATVLGIITTSILIFAGKQIFTIFINEADAIKEGASYLKILGYSQLFMCVEIITAGAFKGIGRTYIPSIILTVLTGARVPMAYFLSRPELLGLSGVWWSISISSILKGILMISVYVYLLKTNKLYKNSSHDIDRKTVLR